MAFQSLKDIVLQNRKGAARGGKGRVVRPDKISFSTDASGGNGKARYALRITIPPEIAKKARFIKGDFVDLLFDKEDMRCQIKRVTEGGWKLSLHSKSGLLSVKVTLCKGMPSVSKTFECDYQIEDMGIAFELPPEASFTENLRLGQKSAG